MQYLLPVEDGLDVWAWMIEAWVSDLALVWHFPEEDCRTDCFETSRLEYRSIFEELTEALSNYCTKFAENPPQTAVPGVFLPTMHHAGRLLSPRPTFYLPGCCVFYVNTENEKETWVFVCTDGWHLHGLV